MSASGRTTCEVSIAHAGNTRAVAWIEFPTEGNKLACGVCADAVSVSRLGTIKRDLRHDTLIECDDCGHQYVRSVYHNCRNVGGEPYDVQYDEGTVAP